MLYKIQHPELEETVPISTQFSSPVNIGLLKLDSNPE